MGRIRSWRAVLVLLLVLVVAASGLPGVAEAAAKAESPAALDAAPLESEPLATEEATRPSKEVPEGSRVDPELASRFVSPSSDAETTQRLRPVDATPVQELVGERTAISQTWVNADGSRTEKTYKDPKFFQAEGSKEFVPIDSSLVVDKDHPGWVRSAANSWSARFGPLAKDGLPGESGVAVESKGKSFSFTPGAMTSAKVLPEIDNKAGTVLYRSVWPNVDLRYTVTALGVKEDVIVNAATDQSSFGFVTSGVGLSADRSERGAGGLVSDSGEGIRVVPPTVQAKNGADATPSARPVLAVDDGAKGKAPGLGQSLSVAVDPQWLAGLKADEFPVTIDPTTVFYGTSWYAYNSTGTSCTYPCGVRVGNSPIGIDVFWHSVAYFPYESLIDNGRKVVSATVNMVRNEGSSDPEWVGVCWATSYSYNGACDRGTEATGILGESLDLNITGLYYYWTDNNIRGGALGFVGADDPGWYTYKDLWTATTVVYNTPPPKPTHTVPTTGAVLSTMSPTFAVTTPGPDADGDAVYYGFSIGTAPDGLGGAVVSSGMLPTPNWTVPAGALKDGQSYYWRAYTYDYTNLTYSDAGMPFKIDMRLGAGGPSPTDSIGPVQVNLATGNVTTSIGGPSMSTVGGSIGVGLTYNSLDPAVKGLTGTYYWDTNNDHLFDDVVRFTRIDPQISFDWGGGSPADSVGPEHFLARWNGYIAPGAGQWDFGVNSDDGIRVWVNGALIIDRWNDQSATGVNWSGPVDFGSGTAKSIKVEYYENGGAASARVYARPSGSGYQYELNPQWLSPDAPPVPAGWTMSAGDGNVSYAAAKISDTAVVLQGTDGSSWEYKKTAAAGTATTYTPPAGFDDVMVGNADGTISVYGDDGYTYVFDAGGRLVSVVAATDDLHPAATNYTWSGSPTRLTSMTDPVSGRAVGLTYGGGSCPTVPSGLSAAPTGMLCKVAYWDGNETGYFYNSNGQLARVVNPGGATTDLSYDGSGRLAKVRDPFTNDAITAGQRTVGDTTLTTDIAYTSGKATSVTAPAPTVSAARPQKTYTYGAGVTTWLTAGIATASSVTFDANNRQLSANDATGKTTTKTWDDADRLTSTTDAAGIKNTTVYDPVRGWATDTYGPAPASSFSGLVGNAGVAHATTSYDDGIQGLAAAYYDNKDLTGAPKKHATGLDASGTVNHDWGTTPPYGLPSSWGVRLTGELTLPNTGYYVLATWAMSGVRIYLDDKLLVDAWTDPGVTSTRSPDGLYNNTVAGSVHRIRIDMSESSGNAMISFQWAPPTGGAALVPANLLKPRYGLATTTTDPTGKVTTTSYSAANGIGPEFGLPTTVTQDPSGLALTTTTAYETPGPTTYLRRTGKTLPAGATSTISDAYYGNTQTVPLPSAPSTVYRALNLGGSAQTFDGTTWEACVTSCTNVTTGWSQFSDQGPTLIPSGPTGAKATAIRDSIWGGPPCCGNAQVTMTGVPNGNYQVSFHAWEDNEAAVWSATLNGTTVVSNRNSGPAGTWALLGPFNVTVTNGTIELLGSTGHANISTFLVQNTGTSCSGGGTSANQGGRLKMSTDADPDGAGPQLPIQHESIYDSAGRTIATRTGTNGGGTWVCTTYDSRGRPATVTYPPFGSDTAGRTVTYNYAVGGNPLVTSVSDPVGTITTTTDLLGRVTSYTDVFGKTTTTAYDQAGRVTTATPPGVAATTYTYDNAGRIETMSLGGKVIADPSYDTFGRLSSVAYPTGATNLGNGTTGAFTYDGAGRPAATTWTGPGSTPITSDQITARDLAGRITDQTIDGTDPYTPGANYAYDNAGRLTTARTAGHTYTYNFAATNPTSCGAVPNSTSAGKNTNRTSMVDNATTVGYCYDNADRITSSTDAVVGSLVYDDHGNATTIFGETHGYDAVNRHLKTVKAATTIDYRRDATDRIVERKLNGTIVARYSSSAGGDTPDLTLDGANNVVEQTLVLPGGALYTSRLAGNVWSYPNTHGDYVAVANMAGVKVGATTTYDPYGNTTAGTVPDNSAGNMDYGWLGQHQRPLEQQTGIEPITEMGARQYSGRLGRFIEQDPIEGGSANDYEYCDADPINCTDLSGMAKKQSRKDLLKKRASLQAQIDTHRRKIRDNPNSRDIQHWEGEIRGFQKGVDRINKRLYRMSMSSRSTRSAADAGSQQPTGDVTGGNSNAQRRGSGGGRISNTQGMQAANEAVAGFFGAVAIGGGAVLLGVFD